MVIEPNTPSMNYTVDGIPMSSEDAFKMYMNSVEFESLTTDQKTIINAINEVDGKCADLDSRLDEAEEDIAGLAEDIANIDILGVINETVNTAFTGDLAGMTTKGAIDAAYDKGVEALAAAGTALDNDFVTFKKSLTAPGINLVEAVFTNPSYFTEVSSQPYIVNPHYVAISMKAKIKQDIQYSDNELEVVNVNFSDNTYTFAPNKTATIALDLAHTPREFYIPARVVFYDSNGDFVRNQNTLLLARWEQAQGGYDLSIYLHDEIDNNGSTTEPDLLLSGNIPYAVSIS